MKLLEWRKLKGLGVAGAARFFGVEAVTYGRHEKGQRMPHIDFLSTYSRLTNGQVTPNDFFDQLQSAIVDKKKLHAVGVPCPMGKASTHDSCGVGS